MTEAALLPSLRLRPHAERRLRAGHLWVYSNEVDIAVTSLKNFQAGDQAVLETASGKPLGIVLVSPNNLICARLVSRDIRYPLDKSLLVHRLNIALSLRERQFDRPFYRLVYGEGDFLPGLVVDRFGPVLVVQIASAAMERLKDDILAALVQVIRPQAVLWKNDSSARDFEALPHYVEPALGDVPAWVALEENGVCFEAPVLSGQKTGWFYDHRLNRGRLRSYVGQQRVLDLFSYIGGWGIQAAVFGAAHVTCIDSSGPALQGVMRNADLNGVRAKVTCIENDVFDALRDLKSARERFDVVIADPPAFIKRKKDLKNGLTAYRRLNEMAMRLLSKDGILVSASCSMHLDEAELQALVLGGARHIERELQLLERGGQGPDHPVHPAIPETRYIKSLMFRVLPV